MKRILPAALTLALAACATTEPEQRDQKIAENGKKVVEAVESPLADLNLVRQKIPPALVAAKEAPYAAPADPGCAAIDEQVKALDEALGPDLDAPPDDRDPSLVERGSTLAGEQAIGAIKGAAEGLIPYRGWVRKLTGAERYSKQVSAAIAAGGVRRAYLKGLGEARNCPAPASPRR